MIKKNIHIFRHGITDWNKLGRMQGHSDIPLNETGIQQASQLKSFFEMNPVDRVISSDLQRTINTAFHATGQPLHEIHQYPSLREINLGQAEGKTSQEIVHTWGEKTWIEWNKGPDNFSFIGGETKNQAQQRIYSGIIEVISHHPLDNIAICTHGFVLKLFLNKIGFSIESIPNCGLFTLSYFQRNTFEDDEIIFEVKPNFEIKKT